MALFVINEWLWADLSGHNGIEHQREALVVIEKLPTSHHQIVIIEGSDSTKRHGISAKTLAQ
jgi:hypothetical protein